MYGTLSVMDQIQEIRKQAGSKPAEVTLIFTPSGIPELVYLLGMSESLTSGLTIHPNDIMLVLAVVSSRDWSNDENRHIRVTLDQDLDQEWFRGRVVRGLKSIVLARPTPNGKAPEGALQGLTFRRENMRVKTAGKLEHECAPPDLCQMVENWGASISFVRTDRKTGQLSIEVRASNNENGELIVRVILDGWKNAYAIVIIEDEYPQWRQFTTTSRLAKQILGMFEAYLEES